MVHTPKTACTMLTNPPRGSSHQDAWAGAREIARGPAQPSFCVRPCQPDARGVDLTSFLAIIR